MRKANKNHFELENPIESINEFDCSSLTICFYICYLYANLKKCGAGTSKSKNVYSSEIRQVNVRILSINIKHFHTVCRMYQRGRGHFSYMFFLKKTRTLTNMLKSIFPAGRRKKIVGFTKTGFLEHSCPSIHTYSTMKFTVQIHCKHGTNPRKPRGSGFKHFQLKYLWYLDLNITLSSTQVQTKVQYHPSIHPFSNWVAWTGLQGNAIIYNTNNLQ